MKKVELLLILFLTIVGIAKGQNCNDVPVINNFTPVTGFIGSVVTVNGANFDPATIANNKVYFGVTKAEVISATFGQLKVIVPIGASTAPISVTNNCGLTAFSQVAFNGIFCPSPTTQTTYSGLTLTIPVSNGAYNMTSADFDLDGKPEIISGGFGGISIAINNSTAGNLNFSTYDVVGSSYAGTVVTADLDGDGLLDLLTSSQIYRNTSTGPGNISFDLPYDKSDVAGYQIYVADINNDGKVDIIGSDGDLKVALNTSTGPGNISFAPAQTVLSNFGFCTGARAADIDGDGKADFFGSQGGDNRGASARNITHKGSSVVAFEPAEYWDSDDLSDAFSSSYPYRLMMADFDKDEKIDFTSPNYNGASVAIWRNNSTVGDISFAPVINLPSPNDNYRIGVGDVDGDGLADIVTKSAGSNTFSTYKNVSPTPGNIQFETRIDYYDTFSSGEISGIVIGDLDGDYVPDLALSGTNSNSIRIYRNQSVQTDEELPVARTKDIVIGLGTDGTVSITANMIDDGSSDACGIDRIELSKTLFTCTDIGENIVTLTVFDRSGNSSIATAKVNIQPAAIITVGQTTVCAGQTVALSANEGDSYQWYLNGEVIDGAISKSYSAAVSGDYTVSVTNEGGCSGTSLATKVTINEFPTIEVLPNGNAYLCGDGSVELVAAPSSLYQWIKDGVDILNATQRKYYPSTVGNYQVRVVDYFGCTATSPSVVISDDAPPSMEVSYNSSVISTGFDVSFGEVNSGVSLTRTFVISNSGINPLRISGYEFVGVGKEYFSITTPNFPFEISTGESAEVNVRFNPTAASQVNVALNLITNDCDDPSFGIDFSASVSAQTIKSVENLLVGPLLDQVYTGVLVFPSTVVKDGTTELIFGTDYSVTYDNNINVGTATVTITGSGNYSGTKSLNFNITSKAIEITSDSDSKIYDGIALTNPASSITDGGLVTSHTYTATVTGTQTTVGSSDNVASAAVIKDASNNDVTSNYDISYVKGALEVNPRAVTITAIDKQKTYGEANPTLTFSYAGLVNGDMKVNTEPSIATTGMASSNVGIYPIMLEGGSDDNYKLTLVNGTMTIGKKVLTLTTHSDQSKVYGATDPTFTYTATGFENEDTDASLIGVLARVAGETVGNYAINQGSLNAGDNYKIEFTGADFGITKKTLRITVNSSQSKIYGSDDPAFAYEVSGFEGEDDESIIEGALSRATGETVGNYLINKGSLDAGDNYNINFTGAEFEITKKAVTITADDKQKTYGEANPTVTFTYEGLVNGDTKVTTEPIISTTATASSNVGTYPITLEGGADQNYEIKLVNGTLTIGKKDLTITADDQQKIYSDANPTLTFSYTGLVNGDTKVTTEPSIATTATASSNVGTYPITLEGGADQNYEIKLVNGTLTIGKKDLTIKADDKQKIYGDANPTLTFTYEGLVNGDTKVTTEPIISTTATASSNVGTYPISLTGGADQNYEIKLVNGTLTIGKKDLTIRADDKQKIYGDANPTLTFTYEGLVNGDTKVTTEPGIATTATASSNVGTYPISLTGGADQNYEIKLVNGTLTIGKKDLTITAQDKQKIYGEANPTLTFTYEGLVNGDTKVTTEPGIATTATASSNVGTYPITLEGGADQNYEIKLVNGTLTIGKKDLTIRADDKQKIYGEANPTLTFTYEGLVNGDTKVTTEPGIATTASASSNVGTYPISLTGGADQNYNITLVNGTLTIGKKDLRITAQDKQKIYGEGNPTLTFTYEGLVNGDTKVTTEPGIATTATASSNVGTYPISLTGGADQNYEIKLVNGTLTIGKKDLTITADDQQKIYGDANPTLTFTYEGLVNGDEKVETEPSIATTATQSSNVGTYPITLEGGADQNYTITLKSGTLTINKAILAIKADSQSKIFGATDPELTYVVSGFKATDNISSLSGKLSRAEGEQVGQYAIGLGTLKSSANYEIVFLSATFEIVPAVLLTISNPDRITTPWSVIPVLPSKVKAVTTDGQVVELAVAWNLSTLNVLKRGTYFVGGAVTLPAGILNPGELKSSVEVVVLAKPAPQDVILSNNDFDADPKNYFQVVGSFTVIDPIDDIHTIRLKDGAADNQYFEVKEGILFWSSADAVEGRTEFTVVIQVLDRDGNVLEKSFTISRGRTDLLELEVYNIFTPNGDGRNDTWGVPDMRYFIGARVQVFDRDGKRLFYSESADDRWDGTYNGKEMPAGTYFWIVEVKETKSVRRGTLTLLKN